MKNSHIKNSVHVVWSIQTKDEAKSKQEKKPLLIVKRCKPTV